jgi:hypothetical protein
MSISGARGSASLQEAGPMIPKGLTRKGDWMCPQCRDHQFGRNDYCRKCGTKRPDWSHHLRPPAWRGWPGDATHAVISPEEQFLPERKVAVHSWRVCCFFARFGFCDWESYHDGCAFRRQFFGRKAWLPEGVECERMRGDHPKCPCNRHTPEGRQRDLEERAEIRAQGKKPKTSWTKEAAAWYSGAGDDLDS